MCKVLYYLNKFNNMIVDNYLFWFVHDIRYLKKREKTKLLDYYLETCTLNVCLQKEELKNLVVYVKKIKETMTHIHIKDVCTATILAYYNICVLEYDEFFQNKNILQYCNNISDVTNLYMGIVGITYCIEKNQQTCFCETKYQVVNYNCDNDIYSKMRQYMLFGYELS